MKVSAGELNRATLARQLLLGREPLSVVEGVRRVVAIQAQHPASPYIALWNRLVDFDPSELDAAFAEGRLVKATLMRLTLHAVHLDDHSQLHTAMQPTLRTRLPQARAGGLPLDKAHELVPGLLEFAAEPRSNAQIEQWISDHCGIPGKDVWWGLRSFVPLLHSPTGGRWSFGQRPAFVAASPPPSPYSAELAAEALEALVWRYLEGFGPASMVDVAQFASVHRARAKAALSALKEKLVVLQGPDGKELYDVPGAPLPAAKTPAPVRLMPMWDSALLACADRTRIVPAEYKSVVTRNNGDVLPTLLVDGHVAGLWRPTPAGIEATAFRPLPAKVWKDLGAEADALATFLADREHRPVAAPADKSLPPAWGPTVRPVSTRGLEEHAPLVEFGKRNDSAAKVSRRRGRRGVLLGQGTRGTSYRAGGRAWSRPTRAPRLRRRPGRRPSHRGESAEAPPALARRAAGSP